MLQDRQQPARHTMPTTNALDKCPFPQNKHYNPSARAQLPRHSRISLHSTSKLVYVFQMIELSVIRILRTLHNPGCASWLGPGRYRALVGCGLWFDSVVQSITCGMVGSGFFAASISSISLELGCRGMSGTFCTAQCFGKAGWRN